MTQSASEMVKYHRPTVNTRHWTQNTFILKGSALKHRSDTEVIEGTELWMLTKNYVKYLKIQIQFSKSGLQLKEIKFTKNPGRVLDSQKRRKKKNLKVGSRGEKKNHYDEVFFQIWNI